jgi:hypothetical protein
MTPALQLLAPERRHRANYRDEIEHAEVAQILSALPERHPARVSYTAGAREASDSISLTWLVADRRDVVWALTEANLAAWGRTLTRQGKYFRPRPLVRRIHPAWQLLAPLSR